MPSIRIGFKEKCVTNILALSPLMPHFWSELLQWADLLFRDDPDAMKEVHDEVAEIEKMVLTEEEIREGLGIYDIEMALESNPDYYSFFVKRGAHITKFDVERRLNKVRAFILDKVAEVAQHMRFSE